MISRADQRKQAEEKLFNKGTRVDEKIDTSLHELQVHQLELEMQNEELRRSEAEREALQQRYFDLYDRAPVCYLTINEKGMIQEANRMAINLLDLTQSPLPNKNFSHLIFSDDHDCYYSHRKKVLEVGGVHTCEMRMLKNDNTFFWASLETVAVQSTADEKVLRIVLSDISEKKESKEKIQKLVVEKERILKEVHHRIKNSMNTIYGLLILQAGTLTERSAINALEDAASRVQSMLLLYDSLYRCNAAIKMTTTDYLPCLIDEIISNFPNSKMIEVTKNIDSFELDTKKLLSLGVILNELLTNIMKYAFTGLNKGSIAVNITLHNTRVKVLLTDDGKGMPPSIDFENSTGFGLVLVGGLVKELDGSIRIVRRNGTGIFLEFERGAIT